MCMGEQNTIKAFIATDELKDAVFCFQLMLPATRLLSVWEYLNLMPDCIEIAEFLIRTRRIYVFGDALRKEGIESVSVVRKQIESLREKYMDKFPGLMREE